MKIRRILSCISVIAILAMMLSLSSCFTIAKKIYTRVCDHDWIEATCYEAKGCSKCKTTEGDALGHDWKDASCIEPKTCARCNLTEGDAAGHVWEVASCTVPETCSVCAMTKGPALGHNWIDATCTDPKTCSVCNETAGSALAHTWEEATCTTPKTCTACKTTEGSALGHNYGEHISKKATCTKKGEKEFFCFRCNDGYRESYSLSVCEPTDIYNMTVSSIAEIITYDRYGKELSLGSGFVYSSDGAIVTNYHVIAEAYSARVTINDSKYTVEGLIAYNEKYDLAVLKINAKGLTALNVCKEEHPTGSTVYAFGSSRGLTATFSRGMITYANRDVDGIACVQHDAAMSSGNSGGPLINQYGEVIGINTWSIRDSQNLNLAVSVGTLDLLEFGDVVSLRDFQESGKDIFTTLKNYAVSNGEYSSEDNTYTMEIGSFMSADGTVAYSRVLEYACDTDELYIGMIAVDEDGNTALILLELDQIDGVYDWAFYYTEGSILMAGTLEASTFSSSTTLTCTSHNVNNATTRRSALNLAAIMIDNICLYMESDLASIGVSASDLGFSNY